MCLNLRNGYRKFTTVILSICVKFEKEWTINKFPNDTHESVSTANYSQAFWILREFCDHTTYVANIDVGKFAFCCVCMAFLELGRVFCF